MYYRNAQAALVVYDLTKASSLVKARHWVAELQRQASPGIVIALVGNKLDLVEDDGPTSGRSSRTAKVSDDDDEEGEAEDEEDADEDDVVKRKVSTAEAKSFAEDEGLLFFETSAKTGGNVAEVFAAIANAIPETALKGRGAGAAAAGGAQGAGTTLAATETGRVQLGRSTEGQAQKDNCAC